MKEQGTAVITGGASGIGAATARLLAAKGYAVAILDLQADAAEEMARTLSAEGAGSLALTVDVSNLPALEAAAAEVERRLGPVTALVTAAGVLQAPGPFLEMAPEEEERIWRINYFGTGNSLRAFVPAMSARSQGAIVTVGSINCFNVLPLPAYNPAKAAVMRLTELLASDLGGRGLRVNGVAPTYTMTPPIRAKIESGERDPEAFRGAHALPILVEPERIAEAIAFLLSQAASAISGVMLPVDAGWRSAITYKTFAGRKV